MWKDNIVSPYQSNHQGEGVDKEGPQAEFEDGAGQRIRNKTTQFLFSI